MIADDTLRGYISLHVDEQTKRKTRHEQRVDDIQRRNTKYLLDRDEHAKRQLKRMDPQLKNFVPKKLKKTMKLDDFDFEEEAKKTIPDRRPPNKDDDIVEAVLDSVGAKPKE